MSTRFEKVLSNIPPETQAMVSKSFDVAERIMDILTEKNMSQKELADLLGKRESEISKWMKGGHNFTLETIARIEIALGETVLTVPRKLGVGITIYKNQGADNGNRENRHSNPCNLSPIIPFQQKDIRQFKVR
ncbi:helix-turn-helix transcriptional regulator [Chitinophaga sp. sic0106]|uniref:helix-turn-helix domain-containing protein n=1 Tax=Chitinophaga sp. sic0106 TaxID=2854785 RepID=UPI001C487D46|nr:helix-turn-helix transcriptional regulator [Chitinophaga sp. sic0106]MBV7531134.1 helix-turn-helix domain-containing protein [Chitinophaga sp. sic0106]